MQRLRWIITSRLSESTDLTFLLTGSFHRAGILKYATIKKHAGNILRVLLSDLSYSRYVFYYFTRYYKARDRRNEGC